jgi:Skp family chaperone for outer membrane proteins
VKYRLFLTAFVVLAASVAGCAHKHTDVAVVDVPRIMQYWPKFINYQNQINQDQFTLQRSTAPIAEKRKQLDLLQQRFVSMQNEITDDVRSAAQQVATDQHYKLVFTRQYVGYGGTDITGDVEKVLKIDEKAVDSASAKK